MLGAVAGIVVPLGVDLLEHLSIDDPIGAVAVHGFTGIWGSLAVGLFATGQYGIPGADGPDTATTVNGLFYGGGLDQLKAQFIGSAACVIVVGGVALWLMLFVSKLPGEWALRLSRDAELEGIDLVEHGLPAYHMEFGQGFSYTTYTGQAGDPTVDPSPIDLTPTRSRVGPRLTHERESSPA